MVDNSDTPAVGSLADFEATARAITANAEARGAAPYVETPLRPEVAAPDNTASADKPVPRPATPTPTAPHVGPDELAGDADPASLEHRFAGPGAGRFRSGADLKLPGERMRDRMRRPVPVVATPRSAGGDD